MDPRATHPFGRGLEPVGLEADPVIDPARIHWHEHPISAAAHLAQGASAALTAALGGLLLLVPIALLFGVPMEMGLLDPVLSVAEQEMLDRILRAVMATGGGLAVVLGLLTLLASGARAVLVSRSLVRAREGGADPAAVPCLWQIGDAIAPVFSGLLIMTLWVCGLAGFFLGAIWVITGDDLAQLGPGALRLLIISSALVIALPLTALLLRRAGGAGQAARRRLLAEHWTPFAEKEAWLRARRLEASLPPVPAGSRPPSTARIIALARAGAAVPEVLPGPLRRAATPQPGGFAQTIAMLGSLGIAIGSAALVSPAVATRSGGEGTGSMTTGIVLTGAVLLAAGGLLLVGSILLAVLTMARGREDRNLVMERWPVRPERPKSSPDSPVPTPVLRGPVLTPLSAERGEDRSR